VEQSLGIHVLFDLFDCDAQLLNDSEALRRLLIQAVEEAGLTPLESASHQYVPQGASVVVLVAESHCSIHTWPEHRYAAVDLFSCRVDVDSNRVRTVLENGLKPDQVDIQVIERGQRSSSRSPAESAE